MPVTEERWSAPDMTGLVTALLTPPDRVSLKGRRMRKASRPDRARLVSIPEDWRALVFRWLHPVRATGTRRRWTSLLKEAGNNRAAAARDLLQLLLTCGAVTIEESFSGGSWHAEWIVFDELGALREALGLPDLNALVARWLTESAIELPLTELNAARDALSELPPRIALARLELLRALARWQEERRQGTLRDFAYFARGQTKAVNESEWRWLGTYLDLEAFGLSAHTPLALLVAPLTLLCGDYKIDLAVRPFVGLAPETLNAASTDGHVSVWNLVENRTSFEHLARRRQPDHGVLWLPGFPPLWWLKSVSRLLMLAPAPGRIACDPDPAGIEIALHAGALWQAAGLSWEPWRMTPRDLDSLPVRQPLTELDRMKLAVLLDRPLPASLEELAQCMLKRGEKGEQEGYL